MSNKYFQFLHLVFYFRHVVFQKKALITDLEVSKENNKVLNTENQILINKISDLEVALEEAKYNLKLSENRVKSVQKYLSDKGIVKARITIDWKGEAVPISDNNTKVGREENRRVELEILNDKN